MTDPQAKPPKRVLTTGQAALLMGCSHRMVIRACDEGTMKFHTIPPSRFRRIERSEVERFCQEHGIPMSEAG